MKLTVLIPLIGVFLLFNEQTEVLFQFPAFLESDMGLSEDDNFTASNLYFTYFALCLLGVASFLFSIFCPRDIKEQPNRTAFVDEANPTETPAIAKSNFQEVLGLRFGRGLNSEQDNNLEYPPELEGDFHALMEEMYASYDLGDDGGDGDDGPPDVMMATGYLDFTEFAKMLWENQRVVWVYTMPFFALAPRYAKDIAFVKFNSLDFSRFKIRVSIFVLYVLGFCLLLVPTLKVFFHLGWGLLNGTP